MKSDSSKHTFTVCFWNILFDAFQPSKALSQEQRLPAMISKLHELPNSTIYGCAEIERENGMRVARALSLSNYFQVHNERPNDYLGVMLEQAADFQTLDLGKRSVAIIIKRPDIRVIVVHLSFRFLGEHLHRKQIKKLLKYIGHKKPVIIMGDFNSASWFKSRKLLKHAGFCSVFDAIGQKHPRTAPVKQYCHIYPWPFNKLRGIGFASDDIYIRGCVAEACGSFEGESDHAAVWAKIVV